MHLFKHARWASVVTATLLSAAFAAPSAMAQTPGLTIDDAFTVEGNTASFRVNLLGALSGVTVDYATRDGTAIAGEDYTATAGTLTIPANSPGGHILVPITQDNVVFELNESFTVVLSNATATIVDGEAEGLIVNDDPVPVVSILDTTAKEGDLLDGAVAATPLVRLANASSQEVTVDYTTVPNSASGVSPKLGRPDGDFESASGTLTFAPGETGKPRPIAVLGDMTHEGNEAFFVVLSNPENATLGDGTALVTIIDNDPVPTLRIADAAVKEGAKGITNAALSVTLSNPTTTDVSFIFSTLDGTAVAGSDYTQVENREGSIPAGQTATTVNVSVLGDVQVEADETLSVHVRTAQNAVFDDGVGQLTIQNDER